ncbi:hypothetical protein CHS0354_035778 [Potamilus streckersoni]|uniref:Uncharacterized protein n=1 Tax=Potamilus streckersoni TaxID=2493646 RepID=A0AAE0SXM7_9BIVA|nr:hypothetical protein CHS0354_035778 [Potamilus streckersoni]
MPPSVDKDHVDMPPSVDKDNVDMPPSVDKDNLDMPSSVDKGHFNTIWIEQCVQKRHTIKLYFVQCNYCTTMLS